MLGLSLEKLIVFAVIAALVIGPQRLPQYAQRLGALVRTLRDLLDTTRERTRAELGADLSAGEWRRLDPRRYDPRAIVRDALAADPATPASASPAPPTVSAPPAEPAAAPAAPAPATPQRRRPRYDSAGRVIRTPA
ncbi:twin-arginine translocase TatA/TatE family subunit [Cnuibacter sp. UC19_7]|uniref:twin-arginine translocase TatA/TatE family subunit n=1 Tax=Cnuibacter sp. UC19_7 TaxID=3350166 RepID=UPI003671DF0F